MTRHRLMMPQLEAQLKRWRWRLDNGRVGSRELHPELEAILHQLEAASHLLRDSADRDHLLLSEFDDACYRALTALDNGKSATALRQLLAALETLQRLERRQRSVDQLAEVRKLRIQQNIDHLAAVRHLPSIRAVDAWLERAQGRIDRRHYRQAEALCRFAQRSMERWQHEAKLGKTLYQNRTKILGDEVRAALEELRSAGFYGLSEQLLREALIEADADRQPSQTEQQRRRQMAEQIEQTRDEIERIHKRLAHWRRRKNHG